MPSGDINIKFGSRPWKIQASATHFQHAPLPLSASTSQPPTITTATIPSATVGVAYSTQVFATGGTPPYTFSKSSSVPGTGGFSSCSASGVITGTASTAETESLVIQVSDRGRKTASKTYSLVVNPASSAFDYYIGPSGSDTNPGTSSSPWAFSSLLGSNQPNYNSTIAANRALMAGKKVGVLPGTYSLQTIAGVAGLQPPGDFSTPQYQVPSGAGPSAVTVVQSTTPRGAILDGQWGTSTSQNTNGVPLFGTQMSAASTKYITIDGFEIKNGSGHLMMMGGDANFNMYMHGTLDNSAGANSAAVTFYACDGLICKNNFVTNIVNTNSRNTGIETWDCINSHVINNTVIMNNAGASAIYTKNTNQFNIEYAYNYVDLSAAPSISGQGILAWDLVGTASNTSTLHHNVILGNNGFNVGIAGVSNTSISEGMQFYNNTVVSTGSYLNGLHPTGSATANVQHYNNVYKSANQSGSGNFACSTCVPALSDYNMQSSFRMTTAGTQCNSLAAWQAAVPAGCIGKDAHSLVAIATFIGGTPTLPANAYALVAGTPGTATGTNPGSTNGQTSGTACDMGAWGNLGSVTQIGCDHSHPANV